MTTATATSAARRLINADLTESLRLGGKPLKVDREKGVIYGVKVVGKHSGNKHGVDGVDGTDYAETALREALSWYEGLKVNCNHPDRDNPKADRDCNDRFGKLFEARIEDGEIFANLRFLKSHPMAERICEAAEDPDKEDLFALSHNARGGGEVVNRRYVITVIREVRSCDIVADGGTNRSLRESKEHVPMRNTLKQIYESYYKGTRPEKDRTKVRQLFEMMGTTYEDMEMDDAGPEADAADHLYNAYKALCKSNPELAKKVLKMMSEHAEGPGEKPEEKPVEKPDEAVVEESRKVTESLRRELAEARKDLRDLREAKEKSDLETHIRAECEKREIPCDQPLLEGLVLIKARDAIGKQLDYIKGLGVRRAQPRSQAPGGNTRTLQESKADIPEKLDDVMNWLRN